MSEERGVEVVCAFCGGRGRDPFGVMSTLATCQVCGGTGVRRWLRTPAVPCAFCRGTGVYPGSRLSCTSCGGVGQVHVPEGGVRCPACKGTARDGFWSDSSLPCGYCRGTGWVEPHRSSEVRHG